MDYMTALDTLAEIAQGAPKRNLWRIEKDLGGPCGLPPLFAGSILELKGFKYRHSWMLWRFEVVSSTSLRPGHRVAMASDVVRACMRPIEVED